MFASPYRCSECNEHRTVAQDALDGFRLRPRENHWNLRPSLVDMLLGSCGCGGQFRRDSPVRCPLCWSADVDLGPSFANID